jgi:hypothetical protein
LELSIPRTPGNKNIFDRIQQIKEQKDLVKQYMIIITIIPLISKISLEQEICNFEKKIEALEINQSESKTELVVSTGVDIYGNGIKINKTIPLHIFSKTEKEEIEVIDKKTKVKLVSLSPNLTAKLKDYLLNILK